MAPAFKVERDVQKGTVGDGVLDADEARAAAEESLAAVETRKLEKVAAKKPDEKKEKVRTVAAASTAAAGEGSAGADRLAVSLLSALTAPSTPQRSNIHVAVRVRPFNGREKESRARRVIFFEHGDHSKAEGITVIKNPAYLGGDEEQSGQSGAAERPKSSKKKETSRAGQTRGEEEFKFHFDHNYDSHTPGAEVFHTQLDVFEDLGTAMLESTWAGFNCSMFACTPQTHPSAVPFTSTPTPIFRCHCVAWRAERTCGAAAQTARLAAARPTRRWARTRTPA